MIAQAWRALVVMLLTVATTAAQDAWSTYRGNAQRTGNTDGKAGPLKPDVLWVHKSADHFIAAPVPVGERLFVSSISGFNVPTIGLLDTSPNAAKRFAWMKTAPALKLPTVSSPALSQGKLVFGDGMHQTDGAYLHCVSAADGRTLWQLSVPGTLVHLEGAPTIVNGKVYLGGGAAGVLCVDLNRTTLDGKEMSLDEIRKIIDKKWAELQAKYEVEKKKDEFAVPPSEDELPRAAPVKLWQVGEKKWHVDAPVVLAGDRLLAATAFLEKEKEGERALYCLDAATGKEKWQARLTYNPWGGPAVKGDLVAIGGSNVSYDVTALKGAKGEVAVFELATGKEKWRKPVQGGVLACVTIAGDMVLATATDGKVRAFDLATGDRRWIYDAKTPFFAPVAVAGDMVYAVDLKGVVHGLSLTDGMTAKWTLDLGEHALVKSPGMVYGGAVVQGGRLYVATCNLAGAFANKPTCVVCIGDK